MNGPNPALSTVWTPAAMGLYQTLWQYRVISHLQVGAQWFTILEKYRDSPWNDHGCPYGFEHFIDSHPVPAYLFDRALGLAKKAEKSA